MLKRYHTKGILEAGIDEAGRGCLAGPVSASCVILNPAKKYKWYAWLNDSKKLNAERRSELRKYIEEQSLCWTVAHVDHNEIDRINILNATYSAMHLAVSKMNMQPELLLIDGNRFRPYTGIPHHCIIKGDGLYLSIAAASILAKTHRDELMLKLHSEYPQYGWNLNKAYGTAQHVKAMKEHGISPFHRRSFHLKKPQLEFKF